MTILYRKKEEDAHKKACVLGSQDVEETVKVSAVCAIQYNMSFGCRHQLVFAVLELKSARI